LNSGREEQFSGVVFLPRESVMQCVCMLRSKMPIPGVLALLWENECIIGAARIPREKDDRECANAKAANGIGPSEHISAPPSSQEMPQHSPARYTRRISARCVISRRDLLHTLLRRAPAPPANFPKRTRKNDLIAIKGYIARRRASTDHASGAPITQGRK